MPAEKIKRNVDWGKLIAAVFDRNKAFDKTLKGKFGTNQTLLFC